MTFGKADCTKSFSVSLENFQVFIAEFLDQFLIFGMHDFCQWQL